MAHVLGMLFARALPVLYVVIYFILTGYLLSSPIKLCSAPPKMFSGAIHTSDLHALCHDQTWTLVTKIQCPTSRSGIGMKQEGNTSCHHVEFSCDGRKRSQEPFRAPLPNSAKWGKASSSGSRFILPSIHLG